MGRKRGKRPDAGEASPDVDTQWVARVCGAREVTRSERIQEVWSGYGELVRYEVEGGPAASVVVKHVRPPRGEGRSHERKLRSYDVERQWYENYAARCDDTCRVARCLAVEKSGGAWRFAFEDLDAAGFDRRTHDPSGPQLKACLRWLAAFHARFLGERPQNLWKTGTYWHLATRPDELRAMPEGALRAAATKIDERLRAAKWQTIVHGDAKPANFCFTRSGDAVAAVDFQYVGGGCGMKDVVYLLQGSDRATADRAFKLYFEAFRDALGDDATADQVEREWRALVPWAWADFQRFLAGWAPGLRARSHEQAWTDEVL